MIHKFANIQTACNFLSTLVLKEHYKWRAYKSEYGDGYNAHPKVRSKSNK